MMPPHFTVYISSSQPFFPQGPPCPRLAGSPPNTNSYLDIKYLITNFYSWKKKSDLPDYLPTYTVNVINYKHLQKINSKYIFLFLLFFFKTIRFNDYFLFLFWNVEIQYL